MPEYLLNAPINQLIEYIKDEEGKIEVQDVTFHEEYNLGLITKEVPEVEDHFQ